MTTGIGIEAIDGIVILFDTQMNVGDGKKREDEKQLTSKVAHGKNWAIGIAGNVTKYTSKLFQKVEESPDLIEKWMKNYFEYQKAQKKYEGFVFNEVALANALSMRNEDNFNIDDTAEYIFGIKIDSKEPDEMFHLVHIDEFGNPQKLPDTIGINYVAIGTGKDDVEKYIDKKITKSPKEYRNINLKQAFQLAYVALQESTDSFSNDIPEPITINAQGVQNYGKFVKDKIDKAKTEAMEEIIKKLSSDQLK